MNFIGYTITAFGLLLLYKNELLLGCFVFVVGGFLAKKIKISIRSAGVVILVLSVAYGYHNSYSIEVLFVMLVGFIMACVNSRRIKNAGDYDTGWGFDLDFSSLGSSDSDGGGDGGGD